MRVSEIRRRFSRQPLYSATHKFSHDGLDLTAHLRRRLPAVPAHLPQANSAGSSVASLDLDRHVGPSCKNLCVVL